GCKSPSRRYSARSGMCSASTESTTAPCALARSVSRIRAACSRAAAAARSEASRCRDIWYRTVTNNPPPRRASTSTNTPAYQAVSWRRSHASGCITGTSRAEPVTRAAQRRDQLRLEAVVDLAAQAADQYLEHVGEGVVIVVPHVRGDGGAIEYAALMQHEQLEQDELLRAQRDRPAAAPHLAGAQVDLQVRDAVARRRQRGPAPRQRLEPGHELPEGERLGQVVVRSDLQPAHPVIHGVERRQHQDRRRHPVTP